MSIEDRSASAATLMPRPRLGIGVTGHRLDRLGADTAAVSAAVDALLGEIERAAPSLARHDLRLISGLADGADSIATDAAIARGWSADAVLPFFRDDYADDFADRDAYGRRLAACASVMELPGDRTSADGSGAAYERAGQLVLAQCDLLITVWDGDRARGRGGTAEIVSEAVLRGVPVIHVDPAGAAPRLLWDGLEELDLGQQTVESVPRGDLSVLPRLIDGILKPPSDASDRALLARFETAMPRRWTLALGYPLLLAVMRVRKLRLTDIRDRLDPERAAAPIRGICSAGDGFAAKVHELLAPRFAQADTAATRSAQRFRSIYVTNFAFAALAVVLSLLGLALRPEAKPALLALELLTIGWILLQTRAGNRAAWHRLWLHNRALAERLRCLAISTQLGELDLRASGRTPGWVAWYTQATARELGLRSVVVDKAYLSYVRSDLTALIDDQVGYLGADAHRMHVLEHRLHTLGTVLFALTAIACIFTLAFKAVNSVAHGLDPLSHPLTIAATIVGAALPAVGAAIYGIRMQGDFAGIAGRNQALAAQLATLRGVIAEDALSFDTLSRRARRVTGLLTEDLASWLQTYDARPLTLPG